ncbi:MAG TPA: SAF domain-containing protein [Acidimicrobiales bacterium]|nr:SAF domain-containing protein [Acidimicrobiales bacterium]
MTAPTVVPDLSDDHLQPPGGASRGRFGVAGAEQLHVQRPAPNTTRPLPRRHRWPWALATLTMAFAVGFGAFAAGRATAPTAPRGPATTAVVVLAHPVAEGQVLDLDDLAAVTLLSAHSQQGSVHRLPLGLSYFPASLRARLVGRQVRNPLPAGTLLVPSELTSGPFPGPGQALVGLELQPSEAPSGNALVAGDSVGVLFVPAASQPPYPPPRPLVTAQVVASVEGQSGSSYVTVLVPARLAARLAAYAQHDEVALVRLGPGVVWPPPDPAANPARDPAPNAARDRVTHPAPHPAAPEAVPPKLQPPLTARPTTTLRRNPIPRTTPRPTTRPSTATHHSTRKTPAVAAHHVRTSSASKTDPSKKSGSVRAPSARTASSTGRVHHQVKTAPKLAGTRPRAGSH